MPLIILILFLGIIAYFVCYLKTARKGQALFPKRVLQNWKGALADPGLAAVLRV